MSYDVIVIGAGTAGLSAFKEVLSYTSNACLIDRGPLGTTCARVGCMPSKVLIQIAHDVYRQHLYPARGIKGQLTADIPAVFTYVRKLRDEWVAGVINSMASFDNKIIYGEASFIDDHTVQVDDQLLQAKRFIIATGSSAVIPKGWESLSPRLLTSDTLFEQTALPSRIAIAGLGVIGLELGQALAQLGIDVIGVTHGTQVGGLTDPIVNQAAIEILSSNFPLYVDTDVIPFDNDGCVALSPDIPFEVDKLLVAIGRRPNISACGLERTSIELDEHGMPLSINSQTAQIGDSHFFIAGDVSKHKPLLHEAADEGRIAGFNATHDVQCFTRRCPISIIFCHPNIAMVGQTYASCNLDNIVIGEACFENQGRSRIIGENAGILRIYAEQQDGLLLGAEMIAPEGEHLAHLLAWAIQDKQTVFDVLRKPYYHPSVEEGLRSALRDAGRQVIKRPSHPELAACLSGPIESLG